MENKEAPLFGRKVIFLNPPMSVQSYVITALQRMEYEVYSVNDVQYAKPVLRLYENAICFAFVDDSFSLDQWFHFLKSFETDPTLSSIFMGIYSIKLTAPAREKFLKHINLPGGALSLSRLDFFLKAIQEILETNGALGRRKYIRLDCKPLTNVSGYIAYGSKLFSFKILDLSAVGFACQISPDMKDAFPVNGLLNNISISMGKQSIVASAVVFKLIENESGYNAVMLFAKGFSDHEKMEVKNFITTTLTAIHVQKMKQCEADFEKYLDGPKVDEIDTTVYADDA